jgi:hypothetical protein
MDEASGNLTDSSTSGTHTATVVGTPVYSVTSDTSLSGTAITFDGSTDYYTIVNHADLRPTNITVSLWIKTTSDSTGSDRYIFESGKQAASPYAGVAVTGENNKCFFRIYSNTGTTYTTDWHAVSTTTEINDGNWHHFVGTYDGSTIKAYFDGVLEATTSYSAGLAYNATNNVLIGARDGSVYYFNGSLDDIKLIPRAISADEVASLYDSSKYCRNSYFISPTDYIAHWTMDDASAPILDSTPNNHDSTATGGTPVYEVAGQVGNAITFDGSTEYFTIADDAKLQPSQVTVSAWINCEDHTGRIFQSFNSDGSTYLSGFYFSVAGGNAKFLIANNGGTTVGTHTDNLVGSVDVCNGTWNHVVATYDGVTLKLYSNGILESTYASTVGIVYNATNYVNIGRYWNGTTDVDYFNGSLDDIKLFDRALAASEIEAMYVADAPVSPTDYVAYWTMNDASGLIQDTTGNHHATTTGGTPLYAQTGQVGDMISFDGSTDYFSISSIDAALKPTSFTVTAWIKSNAAGNDYIYQTFRLTGGKMYGFYVLIDTSSKLKCLVASGTGVTASVDYETATGTTTIDNSKWFHAVCSYNSSTDKIKVYVDGTLETTTSWNGGAVYQSTDYTEIGVYTEDGSTRSNHFNGDIDDLKLFDRALSAAEISSMYIADGGT